MAINVRIGTAFNSRGLTQAQSQFQRFGKSIKKGLAVGAVVAASVAAIGAVAVRFAKMAEEAQIANNRLDQIAHSMGIFGDQTNAVTDRLKAYADANKFVLGADDEVIKSTQAKLLTFSELAASADVAGGAFDRATQLSFDMAAVFGGDGTTNAVRLGKALQDPIKGVSALTRVGVSFTESEKQLIKTMVDSGNTLKAQEFILAAIETQVGGTAEATASASTKMNIAFGEIGEAIGTAVLPMLEEFSNYMVEITPQVTAFFESLTDPTTEVGEAWLDMSGSVIAFGDTIGSVWGQIDSSGIFTGLLKLIETVMVGLSQLVWVAGDAGKTLGLLFSGDFAGAGEQFTSFFTRYNSFVDQLYNKIDSSAASLAASASKRFQAVGGGNLNGVDGGTGVTGGAGNRQAATARAAQTGLPALIAAANKNSKKVTNAGIRATKLGNAGLSKEVAAWIATSSKPAKAANQALARISKNGTKAITNITNAYNKSAAGQAAAAEAAAQASADAAQAAEDLRQAQLAAAQAEADALAERERVYNSFLDSVKSTFAGIRSTILGAFDLTQLGGSTNSIARNMDRLLSKLRGFASNVRELAGMGLDPALLQQVIQAGPMAGSSLAAALVSGGAGALANINRGFAEFGSLSSQIATTGTESLYNRGTQQNIYNINVSGGVGSGATIGQAIVDAIKAYERTSGAVWQGA
jgi:hypothetical protein